MEITPFGYSCVKHHEHPDECYFSVGKIAGKALGVDDLTELLTTGKTGLIRGFTARNKKKLNACLKLEQTEDGRKNIAFDFSQNDAAVVPDVVCPICGGAIVETSFGFGCANYRQDDPDSCRFAIGTMAGKDLNAAQVKELLNQGRTGTIRGFKSKSGKKFDACVALEHTEDGRIELRFDFEHVEAKKIKDVVCPICGGDIVATPFGFGCANYVKDDPNSCRFSVGKMAEKALTEANVKELLTNGRTGTIRGFKSKSGKKFDARVALAKDEKGKVTGLKFDFTDLEEYCLKDNSYADYFLTALLGEDRINTLNSNAGGGNYNQFWSVQSLVNTGNIRNLPKIGFYMTLAVAYIALAGPGLLKTKRSAGILPACSGTDRHLYHWYGDLNGNRNPF